MTQALVPLPSVWNLLAWTGIGVAWIGLLTLHSIAHHPNGLLLFLEWQLMLIVMMLPSVLPVFRSLMQLTPRLIDRIAFVFPYWLIWSSFAVFLLLKPFAHHSQSMSGIQAIPFSFWQEIVLIGAGIFQFTPLKQACLEGCRSAVAMLLTYYSSGASSMLRMGTRYSLNCLGCCWALMLLMLVAGMSNATLMAVLTVVMVVERQWEHGKLFSLVVGSLLIFVGAGFCLYPLSFNL
ncbi:DUF2182 domain-containing protein [Leptolyngbya ohadii]|uniref:DUF2182 domain-containing protein n=1 Tax=Leptolyngbya ohadii TaxID=1962290 RepID=UPI000B59B7F4|nr:DUF2182 domain-containing protein [Leptolyngbya ohadii]